MATTLEARITALEQAQPAEYPWMFVYGKPTPEQLARIDRATANKPIVCFWEDQTDTVWLAGCGKPPPWEMDIPPFMPTKKGDHHA